MLIKKLKKSIEQYQIWKENAKTNRTSCNSFTLNKNKVSYASKQGKNRQIWKLDSKKWFFPLHEADEQSIPIQS